MITQEIKVIGTMIGRGGNFRRSSTITYELVDVDWDEYKAVPSTSRSYHLFISNGRRAFQILKPKARKKYLEEHGY